MLSKQKKFVIKMRFKKFLKTLRRNWYWLVFVLIFVLIIWGILIYYYIQPSTKSSCQQRDGDWRQCEAGKDCLECHLPKEDKGKSCSDSSECLGSCMATTESIKECDTILKDAYTKDKKNFEIRNQVCPAKGTCSKYDLLKGDKSLRVRDGKIDWDTGLNY